MAEQQVKDEQATSPPGSQSASVVQTAPPGDDAARPAGEQAAAPAGPPGEGPARMDSPPADSPAGERPGADYPPIGERPGARYPAEEPAGERASAESAPADEQAGGKLPLPDFSARVLGAQGQPIDLLHDVELNVKVELGRCRMSVEDVLRLAEGAVVELDKLAGDPVDVLVNDRLVARGEVLVLNDTFCVRVNEIVANEVIGNQ